MTRMSKSVAALAGVAMIAMLFSVSPAAAQCLGPGSRTELAPGSVTPGDVDNGQVDRYRFTVPAGEVGYIHLQMFNGDIDIKVCRDSNNALQCEGTNFALLGDGCHFPELSVGGFPPPFNPDYYAAEWGNALPPGTWRLDVEHCFSSVEGPGCDYLDDIQGTGIGVPGAHDAAPPVQYLLAFTTN